MKIAITGHTSGIGKAVYETLSKKYFVQGFSRSNNYDLDQIPTIERILETVRDGFDVFINNAYSKSSRDAQLQLHKALYVLWKDQNKTIIVNSSLMPMIHRWGAIKDSLQEYTKSKQSLIEECEQNILDKNKKCRIVNVKIGLVDSGLTKHLVGAKLQPRDVAPYFELAIENPLINELTVI